MYWNTTFSCLPYRPIKFGGGAGYWLFIITYRFNLMCLNVFEFPWKPLSLISILGSIFTATTKLGFGWTDTKVASIWKQKPSIQGKRNFYLEKSKSYLIFLNSTVFSTPLTSYDTCIWAWLYFTIPAPRGQLIDILRVAHWIATYRLLEGEIQVKFVAESRFYTCSTIACQVTFRQLSISPSKMD